MDSSELQRSYGVSRPLVDGYAAGRESRNSYELVVEFMESFGHPVHYKPQVIEDELWEKMRLTLIVEEVAELLDACGYYRAADALDKIELRKEGTTDIVAAADAMGDTEYVVNGMAAGMGIPLPDVVKEIHRSNMTKLGADGKPIYREDGKVLKGPTYEKPDLRKVLYK